MQTIVTKQIRVRGQGKHWGVMDMFILITVVSWVYTGVKCQVVQFIGSLLYLNYM